MDELSDAGRNALPYYNRILGVTSERGTTADVWGAIRDEAAKYGLESPGVTLQGVNELRGYAAAARNSSERLGRAGDNFSITDRFVATAPWSRGLMERNAAPMWAVQFEHTTSKDGAENTAWRSYTIKGSVPTSVGDLRMALEDAADELANEYETDHIGIGAIRVLSI